jgi:hypothetical protein
MYMGENSEEELLRKRLIRLSFLEIMVIHTVVKKSLIKMP